MSSLKSRKRTERITNALCFIALIFLTCLCMLPIWWIFRSSLMSNAELFKWPPAFFPPRWLFSNYANTLEYFKFWTYLKNTMIIIVPSVIFGTITATMCGYAFARLRFRLRNFLFTLCVGSMLLPTMVTLIPLYIMWTKFFNMSNTFWPLILPYLCGGGAFNIFLIRQFVRSIPRELDEAATIDGAGYFRILLNVIVPSIKSAMIVVAMFLFIQIWNDLLMLEVCPSLASARPRIETHPLGIGMNEKDPARLVFEGKAGKAIVVSLIDMGGRLRLIVQDIEAVKPIMPMPNLPVARVMWKAMPNLTTGVECWITAGGAHHTVLSYDVTAEQMRDWARIMDIEYVHIGADTTVESLEHDLFLSDLAWKLK